MRSLCNERLQAGPSCVDHSPASEKEGRCNPKIVYVRPALASQILNTPPLRPLAALYRASFVHDDVVRSEGTDHVLENLEARHPNSVFDKN